MTVSAFPEGIAACTISSLRGYVHHSLTSNLEIFYPASPCTYVNSPFKLIVVDVLQNLLDLFAHRCCFLSFSSKTFHLQLVKPIRKTMNSRTSLESFRAPFKGSCGRFRSYRFSHIRSFCSFCSLPVAPLLCVPLSLSLCFPPSPSLLPSFSIPSPLFLPIPLAPRPSLPLFLSHPLPPRNYLVA